MSETASLSFRVPKAKAEHLEQRAGAMHRPKSWLLQQAPNEYLEVVRWVEGWTAVRAPGVAPGVNHGFAMRPCD